MNKLNELINKLVPALNWCENKIKNFQTTTTDAINKIIKNIDEMSKKTIRLSTKPNEEQITEAVAFLMAIATLGGVQQTTINDTEYEETPPTEIIGDPFDNTEDPSTEPTETITETLPITPGISHDSYLCYQALLNIPGYITAEEKSTIQQNLQNPPICTYTYDGNLESVIQQIIKNTETFLTSNPDFHSGLSTNSNSGPFIEVKVNEITKALTDVLKLILENEPDKANTIFCQLANISIAISFNSDEQTITAYYDPAQNLIVIFPNNIASLTLLQNSDATIEDYLENVELTINQVMNYLAAQSCSHNYLNQNNGSIITFGIKQPQILEQNQKITTITTDEALLLLLQLTNKNLTLEDYIACLEEKDPQKFYDMLGTNSENMEIIAKIVSAMAKDGNQALQPFNLLPNQTAHYKQMHKAELFRVVTKNTIDYSRTNPDISLLENLILYNIVRNAIASTSYELIGNKESGEAKRNYNPDFKNDVTTTSNIYRTFLAEFYGESPERILELENDQDFIYLLAAIYDIVSDKVDYDDIPNDYYDWACEIITKNPALKVIIPTTESTPLAWQILTIYLPDKTTPNCIIEIPLHYPRTKIPPIPNTTKTE